MFAVVEGREQCDTVKNFDWHEVAWELTTYEVIVMAFVFVPEVLKVYKLGVVKWNRV